MAAGPTERNGVRAIFTLAELCRSVSLSAYSSTGGSDASTGATSVTANGTRIGKFGLSSRDRSQESSSSKQLEVSSNPTADIISRYSPSGYVPNIRQTGSTSGGSNSTSNSLGSHQWKQHSAGYSELFGGDEREVERRDRPVSPFSSSSSSSSAAAGGALWSRSKRRPRSSSTVLTSGHVRAESAASPGEVTIDERGTIRDLDEDEDDDDDDDDADDADDENDENTDDDQHNNNGNSGSAEDACGYGINNNDDAHDGNDDDDDNNDDSNLNNRHHHQQRGVHRTDEVSPAKRNLLSSPVPGGAGGAGLIGVKLDLLTNLATNPNNTELLINNNDQDKVTRPDEDVEIEDDAAATAEVIRARDGTTSIDAIAFLHGGRTEDPEILRDGQEEEEKRNASTSYDIDRSGFGGGSTPPVVQNGVAGRTSGTYGDDPPVPSTSRRSDGHFSGNTNAASNLTSSSPTTPSTAHQGLYRGVADQFVSVPTLPSIIPTRRNCLTVRTNIPRYSRSLATYRVCYKRGRVFQEAIYVIWFTTG